MIILNSVKNWGDYLVTPIFFRIFAPRTKKHKTMIKFFLIVFITTSIVCPIINYTYLFLSFKFKFHKEFVKWIMDDGDRLTTDSNDSVFITPVMSQTITFFIVMYLLYRFLLRPLYYLLVTLPTNGFDWLSRILFKPIKKMQFINELDDKKHI